MPSEARVVDVKELPSTDPTRLGRMDKWIWYECPDATRPGRMMPDPAAPGKMLRAEGVRSEVLILPSDQATPELIAAAIKQREAERAKLTQIRVKLP